MNSFKPSGEIINPPRSQVHDFEMPSSSFLGILKDKSAYTSILYLLILFPVGIGLFVYSITMLSLSLGLAITIFGLPLAYVFLLSLPHLNVIQAGFANVILDVPMPSVQFTPPTGGFLDRFVELTKDKAVQTSMVTSILLFPFSVLAFVLMVTSLSVSLSLTLVILYPLVRSVLYSAGVEYDGDIYLWGPLEAVPELVLLGGISLVGFFLFIGSLHLIRFLAFAHAKVIHYSLS